MRSDYRGIPFEELLIESIDWEHRAEHIQKRAGRKGRPREYSPSVAEATEAAFDPTRVVTDSGSASGMSIKVIGEASGRLLTVIIVPKDFPPTGDWWGASAWHASNRDRAIWYEHMRGGQPNG